MELPWYCGDDIHIHDGYEHIDLHFNDFHFNDLHFIDHHHTVIDYIDFPHLIILQNPDVLIHSLCNVDRLHI